MNKTQAPRPLGSSITTAVVLSFGLTLACAGTADKNNGADPLLTPCAGRILQEEVTNARDLGGHAE